MTQTHYEIYAITTSTTDVVNADTLAQARKIAHKWSLESADTSIMIVKVTEERVEMYRNGGIEL